MASTVNFGRTWIEFSYGGGRDFKTTKRKTSHFEKSVIFGQKRLYCGNFGQSSEYALIEKFIFGGGATVAVGIRGLRPLTVHEGRVYKFHQTLSKELLVMAMCKCTVFLSVYDLNLTFENLMFDSSAAMC